MEDIENKYMIDSLIGIKRCTKCKVDKPLTDFAKKSSAPDGRKSECKLCFNIIYNAKRERQIIPSEKTCTECKQIRPIEEFYRDNYSKTGRGFKCVSCRKKIKEKSKISNDAYNKIWREKNKYEHRLKVILCRFKKMGIYLSTTEYLKLLEEHDKKCAICGEEYKDGNALCLDHCHKTNIIRGFLCKKCNQGLGLFQDNPELLIKAYQYLNRD